MNIEIYSTNQPKPCVKKSTLFCAGLKGVLFVYCLIKRAYIYCILNNKFIESKRNMTEKIAKAASDIEKLRDLIQASEINGAELAEKNPYTEQLKNIEQQVIGLRRELSDDV